MPQSQTVDAKSVADFVSKFSRNELAASVKSQPIPKVQEDAAFVVVADTFDEVILQDNKRDILLELYASWCGHCKFAGVLLCLVYLR